MTSYLTISSPGDGTLRRVNSQTIARLFAGDDENEAHGALLEAPRTGWAAAWARAAGPLRDVMLLLLEEHRAHRLEILG